MFRELRLQDNALPEEEAVQILKNGIYGVLALEGDDHYPYAVPINYAFEDGKIYFHGAKEGHKVIAILRNEKASLCVVSKSEIVPDKFNCLFRSAIAFGKIHLISEETGMEKAMEAILKKYSSDFMAGGRKYFAAEKENMNVYEFDVEHLTGKQGLP